MGKICDKFRAKLKKAVQGFDKFIDRYTGIALEVTTKIKNIVSLPVVDVITGIIPGNLDNVIVERLRVALDVSIDALGIIGHCNDKPSLEQKIQCFVIELKKLKPADRDAVLIKLGSLVTAHLDGNRHSQHMYDLYTQVQYSAGKMTA